jgi:hypothetical protein
MRTRHLTWSIKENDLIFCEKYDYPPNSNKTSTLEVTKFKFWVRELNSQSESPVEMNISDCIGFRTAKRTHEYETWVGIEKMTEHFVDSTLEILRDKKIDNLLNI